MWSERPLTGKRPRWPAAVWIWRRSHGGGVEVARQWRCGAEAQQWRWRLATVSVWRQIVWSWCVQADRVKADGVVVELLSRSTPVRENGSEDDLWRRAMKKYCFVSRISNRHKPESHTGLLIWVLPRYKIIWPQHNTMSSSYLILYCNNLILWGGLIPYNEGCQNMPRV